MTHRARQAGFTLIEVLVAAVLIGSVFVAAVSLMSQSLRNIDRMRPHEIAMQHAREVMNLELVRDELQAETQSGQWDDGYRWTAEIAPLDFVAVGKSKAEPRPVQQSDPNNTVAPGSKTLFRVKVSIDWGQGANAKSYEVQTLQWGLWSLPKRQ